jgi:hypothetical protein
MAMKHLEPNLSLLWRTSILNGWARLIDVLPISSLLIRLLINSPAGLETDSPSDGSGIRRCTFTLHKQGSDIKSDIIWRWSEVPKQMHSRCEKPAITFAW